MGNKVIICGGNGAGKSTLGKRLAKELGWTFRDIEDYYFPEKDSENKYATGRTGEEVAELLVEDMKRHENLILASVRGNHSDEIVSMFTCAVVIEVPKEIRMERIRNRSYGQFGDRILPGGDLHEQQERFFSMVENRPEDYPTKWLEEVDIPVIYVDGTKTVEENVNRVAEKIVKEKCNNCSKGSKGSKG
ncbi:MAG: AAA family ATPase [Lachnospiraceae bacterium]|nr:AAA family ATPase [Lachnospiraceae bacterium]